MTSATTKRFRPSLEALETRLVPATRVWDGGAAISDRWQAPANWENNTLPVAGDDLVFPAGAERLSNVNDFAIGTQFGSITFTGSGYDIRGNRVIITGGGIDATQQIAGTNRLAINVTLSGSDNPVSVGFANFSGGVLILDNQVSGSVGLVKSGPGTLEFAGSGANTFSGPVQVNAGTLRLNKPGATAVAGSLVIGDGTGTDSATLLQDNQIANGAAVTINDSGRLNLNGHDDTIGPLTLTSGDVVTGTGLLTLNGNVTVNAASTASTISGRLSLGGVPVRQVTVADGSAAEDLVVSAAVSGLLGTGMTKGGPGKMVLSGANDAFTGPMQIDAGILRITSNKALGVAGSPGTTVADGATLEAAGGLSLADPLTLNGAGTAGLGALFVPQGGGSTTWTGTVTLAGNTTVRAEESATFTGAVGGPGGLTKTGAGTLRLGHANDYAGATTVSQGRLTMGHAQALGSSAAPTTVQAGAALEGAFNGTSNEPLTLNGNGVPDTFGRTFGALSALDIATFAGTVTLAGNTKVGAFADDNNNVAAILTLSGAVAGSGGLTTVGLVTLSGSAPNTYAGNTQVGDGAGGSAALTLNKSAGINAIPAGSLTILGSVTVASANQIPDGVPITGGGLAVNAAETIGPLTLTNGVLGGTGPITLGGDVTINGFSRFQNANLTVPATRTITVNAGGRLDVTNSPLGGGAAVGLVKAGPGILNLQSPASYGGTTTVNAGTLIVSAAVAGPVVVNGGASLAGNNPFAPLHDLTVTGGTVGAGLELSGPATGILASDGDVTLDAGSSFRVDIRGTSPGSGHDQLRVSGTGAIDLGNAVLDVGILSPFQSAVNSTYVIVRNDTPNDITTRFTRADGSVIEDGNAVEVVEPDGDRLRFRVFYDANDGNDVMLFHESTNPTFTNRQVTAVVAEGGFVTLTGTIVEPDPLDSFILEINWGDGTPTQTLTRPPGTSRDINIRHRYLDNVAGLSTISLAWHDQHGGGNTGVLTTTVQNVDPIVKAGGPVTLRAGGTVERQGKFTDPGADTWTATVDYGDGSALQPLKLQGRQFSLVHRYRRPGTYTATVTVHDDDGGVGTQTFTVTVLPRVGARRSASGGEALRDSLFALWGQGADAEEVFLPSHPGHHRRR